MVSNKQKTKVIEILNDYAFKKVFGEIGQEPLLTILLNGLLGRFGENTIKNIEIIERTIPRENYTDKEIQLDILARTDTGEEFIIESQLKNMDMKARTTFYGSTRLYKAVKKGQDYKIMNPVVLITIFGNTVKKRDKNKDYHEWEKTNDYMERHEFIIPKFDKLKNKNINNPQHRCLLFLSPNTSEKMKKKVINMEPKLAEAQEIMDHINSSPEEKELYDMRELVRMDIKNARENDLQEGKEIGIEEGKEIGIEEGKIEIAKKLKNKGFSNEKISEITNLNKKIIKKL